MTRFQWALLLTVLGLYALAVWNLFQSNQAL